ncbi:glycosyl transferase family 2 [Actinocorallia herbida]|uniref:4,4'-diaponeurosporenoate glycosyltransferase n=1 Tax=Actinocorallia herbida TaxID=58109 RepID=A0A3N1CN82_9ACTN|nr:glycosyl transferase family 2 [Actinocorallia herbida]
MPAHNEEAVIGDGLRRLLAGTRPGEVEVIVVANACTDRTAEAARAAGVRVIETEVPGKHHALHLGDAACAVFPRLYLDADVALTGLRALLEAIARPGVLACAPVPHWDLTGCGPVVRRVHRTHDRLIAPTRVLAGAGAYLLSEEGHRRVFPLPDGLLADDGWVHAAFTGPERTAVPEAVTVVRQTRTVRAHLRRRARVRRGNRQLAALGRPASARPLGAGDLLGLARRGGAGPLDVACYAAVMLLDKASAHWPGGSGWGADRTSRAAS